MRILLRQILSGGLCKWLGRPAAILTNNPNHRFRKNLFTWLARAAAEPVPYVWPAGRVAMITLYPQISPA
jgi:hypothetical protein